MQLSARLLRMGLPELVYRSRQESFKWVDRIRSIGTTTSTRLEDDRERLSRFIKNSEKRFFNGVFDGRVPEVLSTANVDECQSLLVAAHRGSHGQFDLLGYRNLEFGDPIDWHFDPVSGRRAPLVHWSRLDPLDCTTVGDTKVIWELNRHQWLVHLGQAWRLTGDERYAQTLIQYVQAWLRVNPPGMGINWASSLEVAFRLIAWCWALVLIRDSRALTADVFCQFEEAVEAHATHVERYLSYYFSPNTHLTGEALGLFYAGVVFPEMKRAERWRSLAMRILVQEIERQVLPDGVYFERSTCYQRYTVDIYLHFLILASRAGIEVPAIVGKIVKSMIEVLVTLRQPDGSMPSIGDADGGMVLPLSRTPPDDYRATFSTAAVVFNDPVYAWAAGRLASDTLWLLGTPAVETFETLEKKKPQSAACRVFPAGGFVAMRSGWDERAHALIFDAGPLGCHFSAGHGHADLLSVQCSAFGQQYLVDAGTCCYTSDPEVRDFFRSTAAHSTVMVDGESHAKPAGPFSWRSRCAAQLLRWTINDSFAYADAIHDAYRPLPDPVSHRRRVAFIDSRYWLVIDDLCGSKSHRIDVRFQFAPMQIRIDDAGWVCATRNDGHALLLRAFASAPFEIDVREGRRDPMEGWVSRDYGQIEPAPVLVYTATTKLPVRILTLLWPAENVDELPNVDVIRDSQNRPCGVTLRDRFESIIFDDDEDELLIQKHS
jgi:uncharacterized heparinase superfamily protein